MADTNDGYERPLWKQVHMSDGRFAPKFDSPRTLWDKAKEYFNFVDSNPAYCVEQLKKPLKSEIEGVPPEMLISIPRMHPYTKQGLCAFCHVDKDYFSDRKLSKENSNPNWHSWKEVFDMIDSIIFDRQYSGAAAGYFNPSIVARGLGLADKKEIDSRNENKEVFEIGGKQFEF